MIITEVPQLKIHTLTEEQYKSAKEQNKVENNELYLTPAPKIAETGSLMDAIEAKEDSNGEKYILIDCGTSTTVV